MFELFLSLSLFPALCAPGHFLRIRKIWETEGSQEKAVISADSNSGTHTHPHVDYFICARHSACVTSPNLFNSPDTSIVSIVQRGNGSRKAESRSKECCHSKLGVCSQSLCACLFLKSAEGRKFGVSAVKLPAMSTDPDFRPGNGRFLIRVPCPGHAPVRCESSLHTCHKKECFMPV